MIDIKITDLESTTDLEGLYTIGTDKNNLSKKVSFDFLKDAAGYANRQGDYAKEVGDTIVGNVGVAEYPQFSENVTYRLGEVVLYNGSILFSAFLNAVIVVVGDHVIVDNLFKRCTHQALQQSAYKACTVLSFIAMDQIRPIVVNDKAHPLCQAV